MEMWSIFQLLDEDTLRSIRMASVYGTSGNEVMYVTHEDEVFAFGQNCSACLGTGDAQGTMESKRVDALCKKKVVKFAAGSGPHVLAITESGDVYSWGHNGYCQLGSGNSNAILVPSLVQLLPKKVVDVSCGSHHTLVLTSDGEVYAWGQNNCGQIGSGSTTNQSSPRRVSACIGNKRVVDISCGQSTSMAALEGGEVFGWGYNGNGQIGIGNSVNQNNPYRVTSLSGICITKVSLGYAHTLALSDEGEIFTWGANSYGQLGAGDKTVQSVPSRIMSGERVVDIGAVHYAHLSACVTEMGKVYMWGQCRGQSVLSPLQTNLSCIDDVFSCFACPAVTPRMLEFSPQERSSTIIKNLEKAFDDEAHSDIKFVIDGKVVYGHKSFLKIRCSYFATMFQAHWDKDNIDSVQVTDHSYAVFRAFLFYLYTDRVELNPEDAISLLDLANAYCEESLKSKCQQIIRNGIAVENAAMLYAAALKYEAKELEEFCFRFALNHMTEIAQTEAFNKLEETTVKNLIKKAAQCGAFKH